MQRAAFSTTFQTAPYLAIKEKGTYMLHIHSTSDLTEKELRDIEAKCHFSDAALDDLELIHYKAIKAGELDLFRRHLTRFLDVFTMSKVIVELGGGSGWACYYIKRLFNAAKVFATDIAPGTVSVHKCWESFFCSKIDGAYCAKSYDLPFESRSVDLAFCFQAAHHFGKHRRTFGELKRVLRPGGVALYLDEPVCSRAMYTLAHRRVNRRLKEDGVAEDVLIYSELMGLSESIGFKASITMDPHQINRSGGAALYFKLISIVPIFQRFMPTTADLRFDLPA